MQNTKLVSKVGVIFFMCIILLIPASLIQNLVEERSKTSENASSEIADKWGKAQFISGPTLLFNNSDFIETSQTRTPNTSTPAATVLKVNNLIQLAPTQLKVDIKTNPLIKKRGIFETVVYISEITMSGYFELSHLEIKQNQIIDSSFTTLSMNVSDMKGIISTSIQSTTDSVLKSSFKENQVGGNIGSRINLDGNLNQRIAFSIKLKIRGHKKLEFVPSGMSNSIVMTTNWNTVSFLGTLLPNAHKRNGSISIAIWDFPGENFGIEQFKRLDESTKTVSGNNFTIGASFITPVDHYQKVIRSTKYAILFIILTYSIFFFIEILNKKRIHPIQYLLVSAALLLFYTLLLSLSEQLGFSWAYLISSTAIITLITFYTKSILNSAKLSFILSFSLLILYGFLYFILQLENLALLAGTIGLFIALSILMIASRKFDWYAES